MAQAKKLRKYKSLFSTTLSTGISTGTGETITPASVAGLPTDTEVTLTIDRVDASGTATPTKMERITGTISGGNLTSYTRGIDGSTEQAHSAGAVIEMIWNADDWNDAVDMLLVEHNDAGTHKAALVTTLKAAGSDVTTGTSDVTIVTPKALADAGFKAQPPKRTVTVADSATPTPNCDTTDDYTVTALAQAATFGAPTGTPINGQTLVIRVLDNGTARALDFNAKYRFGDIPKPTTTVLSKTLYLGFIYNTAGSGTWDCVAYVDNF